MDCEQPNIVIMNSLFEKASLGIVGQILRAGHSEQNYFFRK